MDVKTKKQAFSTVAGAFDPILRNWAQKIAPDVPPDSFLRSDFFQAALGSLKGLVEAVSEKVPPGIGVAIEKLTDFGDFFTGALGSRDEKTKRKVVVKTQDWMNCFLAEAEKRISQAKDEEALDNELKRLKKEFEIRKTIVEIVEAAAKATEPVAEEPKIEPIDWDAQWKKLKKPFEKMGGKIQDLRIKEKAKEADQKIAGKIWQFHSWLNERGVK